MSEEIEKAWAEFRRQQARVAKAPAFTEGAGGIESAYSTAYQALVRLGAAPQLRKKYRG
jgi:hypothetical protein